MSSAERYTSPTQIDFFEVTKKGELKIGLNQSHSPQAYAEKKFAGLGRIIIKFLTQLL